MRQAPPARLDPQTNWAIRLREALGSTWGNRSRRVRPPISRPSSRAILIPPGENIDPTDGVNGYLFGHEAEPPQRRSRWRSPRKSHGEAWGGDRCRNCGEAVQVRL